MDYNARWYSETVGVFTQPDTVASFMNPQGLNRFSYVGNNPLNRTDPSGNTPIACPDYNPNCNGGPLGGSASRGTDQVYCQAHPNSSLCHPVQDPIFSFKKTTSDSKDEVKKCQSAKTNASGEPTREANSNQPGTLQQNKSSKKPCNEAEFVGGVLFGVLVDTTLLAIPAGAFLYFGQPESIEPYIQMTEPITLPANLFALYLIGNSGCH